MQAASFAPLDGEIPLRELARHPSDQFSVMLVFGDDGQRAAVWDRQSGQLAWAPEGTRAMTWMPDGQAIALIRDGTHGPAVPGDGQRYLFERHSWPGQERLSACDVTFDLGYPVDLAISPLGNLAACQWIEEGYAGFEFIQLTQAGDQQMEDAGYETHTDVLTRPVFSPDGRFLAFGAQDRVVWWADSYEAPAQGGDYEIGWVTVLDWQAAEFRDIFLDEEVAAGWRPDPTDETVMLTEPRFIDALHFSITLPTGHALTFAARP